MNLKQYSYSVQRKYAEEHLGEERNKLHGKEAVQKKKWMTDKGLKAKFAQEEKKKCKIVMEEEKKKKSWEDL